MDNEPGKNESKGKRKSNLESISPSNKIFFLNNDLVRLVHYNRPNNICSFYNITKGTNHSMVYSDFKKHRKKAYSIAKTLRIFKRSRVHLERLIKVGLIPPPTGAGLDGTRQFQRLSYYSEDDLFTIREALGTLHRGRPRKDGRITPRKDVPTENELRSLLGDAIMLYTKNKDGEFIPIWAEETW
jgi:hypothetical protein